MSPSPAPDPTATDRRRTADRRAGGTATRRAPAPSTWQRWLGIAGRDLLVVAGSVIAIVFAVRVTSPIFANEPTVVERLSRTAPAVAKAVLMPPPGDTSRVARLVASPQFETDRRAFAADLVATGHIDSARADSVAYYAVRESYVNGIPPAVVFGVMLTENSRFVSSATSNVGAVGLMQVYPKVWLEALSARFGKDLATDSTNLKYGVYILKQYIKSDSGRVTRGNVGSGLLKYNGCVRGTNTPNCRSYPAKVRNYVEAQANSICGDKSFYACIARPFIAGLLGRSAPSH